MKWLERRKTVQSNKELCLSSEFVTSFAGTQHLKTLLIFGYLTIGCAMPTSTNADVSASPSNKVEFNLLDTFSLPDSADHLAWNTNSDKLVVGSWPEKRRDKGYDSNVAVLELKNGRLKKSHQFTLNPEAKGDDFVAFSPDDRYLAVGNTTVELFDLKENRSVWATVHGLGKGCGPKPPEYECPTWKYGPVGHRALAFANNGKILSIAEGRRQGDRKNTVLFWGEFDMADGSYHINHEEKIFDSFGGGNTDSSVRNIDARWTLTAESSTYEETMASQQSKGNPDDDKNWLSIRDFSTGQEIKRIDPEVPLVRSRTRLPTAIALSQDGRYLFLAGDRYLTREGAMPPWHSKEPIFTTGHPYFQIWNLQENKLMHQFLKNVRIPTVEESWDDANPWNDDDVLPVNGSIRSADFSPDGRLLLLKDSRISHPTRPNVYLIDVQTGQRVWTSDKNIAYNYCRFSPSGDMFACSGNRKILVYQKVR